MAIKACKECGNEVSTKADKCPYCGYILKRQYGCFSIILALMIIVVIINVVLSFIENSRVNQTSNTPKPTNNVQQSEPPAQVIKVKTPEELRHDQIKKFFSTWDGSHTGLERYIKNTMHDPSSYKHIETKYLDKGDHLIVSTSFRGKNKFGALVKNSVVAKTDMNGNVISIISN